MEQVQIQPKIKKIKTPKAQKPDFIYKNKSYSETDIKALRKTDYGLYMNIVTDRCYKENLEYRERKKASMRAYYYANKELLNAKRQLDERQYQDILIAQENDSVANFEY